MTPNPNPNTEDTMSKWRAGIWSDGTPHCSIYEGEEHRGEATSPEQATRICALLNEREALWLELRKLANEAEGFWSMASRDAHGHTNMQVMQLRISEARAALAASEPSTPAKAGD